MAEYLIQTESASLTVFYINSKYEENYLTQFIKPKYTLQILSMIVKVKHSLRTLRIHKYIFDLTIIDDCYQQANVKVINGNQLGKIRTSHRNCFVFVYIICNNWHKVWKEESNKYHNKKGEGKCVWLTLATFLAIRFCLRSAAGCFTFSSVTGKERSRNGSKICDIWQEMRNYWHDLYNS